MSSGATLNPRQFTQPRLFDVGESMPYFETANGGSVVHSGDEQQPLYRYMKLNDPDLTSMVRDGDWDDPAHQQSVADALVKHVNQPRGYAGDSRLTQRTGFHWSHDKDELYDMGTEKFDWDDEDDSLHVTLEADHPGRDSTMRWENPDDLPVMERTIGPEEYKGAVYPEVPIRPGASISLRGANFRQGFSDEVNRDLRFSAKVQA